MLLKIGELREPEVRQFYIEELESHLGRTLGVSRFDNARYALWALLNACLSDDETLTSFFHVLRALHGEHPAIGELERAIEDLRRPPLLAATSRESLVHLLGAVRPAPLQDAFFDVIGLAPDRKSTRLNSSHLG